MKKINKVRSLIVILVFPAVLSALTGCAKPAFDINSIQSYKEIPGVTDEEIEAIENIKTARKSFKYGQMLETEAFVLPDGTKAGFAIEFCKLLTRLFGIEFAFEFYDWQTLLNGINSLDIDFTGDLTPTEERQNIYYMTHPIAERTQRIFTLKETFDNFRTEKDADGRTIGYLKNSIDARQINAYYPDLLIHFIEIDDFNSAAVMLINKEIDAFATEGVMDPEFDNYEDYIVSKEFFPLAYSPVSMTTANPELNHFISVVNKYITAGGADELYSLYRRCNMDYARYKLSKSFTQEERAYINKALNGNPVKVVLEADNYPVSFYDKTDKEFEGIAIDVLAEISALTGIVFAPANGPGDSWPVILDMLKNGEASLVSQLLYTGEREGSFLWSAKPYASARYALISKFGYPDLANIQVMRAKAGTVINSAYADKYNEWFPGSNNLVFFNSTNDVLEALEKGKIDLLMGSEYMLLMQHNYLEKPGFKINILFHTPMDSYFGFNIKEEVLCSIVNKTMEHINTQNIANRWTNRGYDYAARLSRLRLMYTIVIAVIAAFLIIRLMLFNRRLNKLVLKRTSKLEQRENMMKILNEAAIVFLSRRDNSFNNIMTNGINRIADILKLDRMSVWKNDMREDGLHVSQFYRWDRESGGTTNPTSELLDILYSKTAPDWPEILGNGGMVNSPVSKLSETAPVTAILKYYKVISVFVTPVFIDGAFWGFAMFEDRVNERYFDDNSVEMMKNAALLCANAVILSEMEKEIITAKESAELSSSYKTTFLANMSHEIRTPMNAVLGITEILLQDDSIPQKAKEALGKIYDSGDVLMGIINDILDLTKIEAGKLELVTGKYDLPSLINDTIQINRMRYESKPIEFALSLDEKAPLNLYGDELRIKQILNNMLSNAYKYTEKGRIEFAVYSENENKDEDGGNVTLVFRITDTGQGMANEQIEKLFDEYTRFNMDANRTIVGAGLGMSITKRLIDLMGGEIAVESEPGKGSVFTVKLPQKRADSLACGKEIAEKLTNFCFQSSSITKNSQVFREPMPYGSVLIVDDVKTNIFVTRGMLTPYGLKIDSALSGFEAIEKVKEGNAYDIIFMDHMMPKMDGIEAAGALREMGYNNPIIALTANAIVGQSEMFLENGFDGYLSKPIDTRELNQILNEFIRNKKTKSDSAGKTGSRVKSSTEKYFILDAEKAISLFENLNAALSQTKLGFEEINSEILSSEELDSYNIAAHGMKTALANIGETGLSEEAFKLETAANEKDFSFIAEKTPRFIEELKALVNKLKQKYENERETASAINNEDLNFLMDKLAAIKNACASFDILEAKNALNETKQKAWPQKINEYIDEINVNLLHSAFAKTEGAAGAALDYCKELKN